MNRIWLLLVLMWTVSVQAAPLPASVAKALREAGIPAASVGVFVQGVAARKPLIAHQANKSMSPASTMKLVTTYAGLELLGPAYTWKTEVLTGGTVAGDVLTGDLVIKGYGDPALTLESFWKLLRDVRGLGIREIHGDLVLDNSYFQATPGDPGSFDNEPYRPYNVMPEALLVNFKTVRFRLVSEAEGGVRIIADPAPARLRIVNRLQLDDGPCNDWHERVLTEVIRYGNDAATVVVSGSYPRACGDKSLYLSLFNNTGHVDALFRQLWQELGGTLVGSVHEGVAAPGARLLARRESKALAEVVRDINKFSNNVMARQLLLTIGREIGSEGSARVAGQVVDKWLAERGMAFPEMEIENGSGLSRTEHISPTHLGTLLLTAWRGPLMAEFVSSLPIAAVDGTMKKRLHDQDVAGHAHIKTGSLRGVKAIAGYVHDRKGRSMVVVFFINHPDASAGQAAQDALLEWVYSRN
ncbi:D-alanyl-D-alanine carboxypeptidase/D-alanyl-D-alanine-endopeptidase [Sulfuricella denitrificans skB26]|uniref:D-alanyl-D-alanine carboxypeptidase/D-alanyl-D-alanine-endopeptidase n=1 Tax=Sulfuricella denitrificans (strain DSM 22764 / NBRC 105220 / skB26) TaxID=1163617 RepID=S6A9M0_SULDS|nr:D-alanyl-D-alanine carboxypeptidase/D-alanyl-D-alanine-endopeptidase [Sulfuricella denitrificans]BAN34345.1 D-alanyl-D-alanine carboxypeptidase/D-alanyl-D-alanine-endopeptidase [Sulfuricella denitrificans skB26]